MACKSPFPGMDPYLERHWGDVRHSLVQYASDYLQGCLPDPLRARIEERVFPESDDTTTRNDEPLTEGFIRILDGANEYKVTTVVEFLSAANKAGANGTQEYLQRQRDVLSSDINLVEIDLLRRGQRVTAMPRQDIPLSHRTPYHVCVHRAWQGPQFEIYRLPLRERLPIIPIPLRQTDKDVTLDLQAVLDQAYRLGRYDDLDYHSEPDPPLDPEEARWADELLRREGRR